MSLFSCKEVLDKVFDYLHSELDLESRKSIDEHLKSCKSCAEEYALETQISSMVVSSGWETSSTEELVQKAMRLFESEEPETI